MTEDLPKGLLRLVTRGDSRGMATGHEIGVLGSAGKVKLNRVTGSLGEVLRAGRPDATWALIAAALPALLALDKAPRGTTDLLQIAARAAAQVGARADIPGLAAAAGRAGSSQLGKDAARLQRVLAGEPL